MKKIYFLLTLVLFAATSVMAQKKVMVLYDFNRYDGAGREDSAACLQYVQNIMDLVVALGYTADSITIDNFDQEVITVDEVKAYDAAIITPSLSSSQAAGFGIIGDSLIPHVNLCPYAIRIGKKNWMLVDESDDANWMADKTIIDSLKPAECMTVQFGSHDITKYLQWEGQSKVLADKEIEFDVDNAHIQTFKITEAPYAAAATSIGKSTWGDIPAGSPKDFIWAIEETTNSKRGVHASAHTQYPLNDNFKALITASLKWVLGEDMTPSSISNAQANLDLAVYPNPAEGQVTVQFTGAEANVTIMNTVGQVVYNDNVINNQPISVSEFAAGYYIVQVTVNNKTLSQNLIIK